MLHRHVAGFNTFLHPTNDREGRESLVAIVKGTFTVDNDGQLSRADEQAPIVLADDYRGDPLKSSVRYESDLAIYKPGTDVIVNGDAVPPGGEPATQVDVSVRVGALSASVRVIGDRVLERAAGVGPLAPSSPAPFTAIPIVYERAYGGYDPAKVDSDKPKFDERNPAGTGYHGLLGAAAGMKLPNVYERTGLLNSPLGSPTPAGVGVIARWWPSRRKLAGTYDEAWKKSRMPFLPLDFDYRHFHCASPGLNSPTHLAGDEEVRVTGMTPEGEWSFKLPGLMMGMTVRWQRHEERLIAPLDTVYIEPPARRVILVWRRALSCRKRWAELIKVVSVPVAPWAAREVLGERALELTEEPCYRSR